MIQLPLFETFPNLAKAVPYQALGQWPTPLHRAWRFGTTIGCDRFWIKRDDQTHAAGGGNKVRGLEFLLGQAQHHKTLLVVSTEGSHHLVATAYHAASFGQRVVAVTFPQPETELVARNRQVTEALGVERHCVGGLALVPLALGRVWRDTVRREGIAPFLMPLGGTSPHSCLGHVNAALELAEQVRTGQMPEPEVLFVALGSGGTLAGLLLGVRLAGLATEVIGVRVAGSLLANAVNVAGLYNRTRDLIAQHYPGDLLAPRVRPRDIVIRRDCYGRGYGYPTELGETLRRRMVREERIELEGTYTAKALAGLVRTVQERRWQKRVILFWNTYGPLRYRQAKP